MSTETSTLEVFILDKSYRINCPESEQESLRASAHLSGSDLLEAMVWDLTRAAGTDSFPDDVSGIVLDLLPEVSGQHCPVPGISQPGQCVGDG